MISIRVQQQSCSWPALTAKARTKGINGSGPRQEGTGAGGCNKGNLTRPQPDNLKPLDLLCVLNAQIL